MSRILPVPEGLEGEKQLGGPAQALARPSQPCTKDRISNWNSNSPTLRAVQPRLTEGNFGGMK